MGPQLLPHPRPQVTGPNGNLSRSQKITARLAAKIGRAYGWALGDGTVRPRLPVERRLADGQEARVPGAVEAAGEHEKEDKE